MRKIIKKSPKRKLVCPRCICEFSFRLSDIDGLYKHSRHLYDCIIKCPDCGCGIFVDDQGNANPYLYNGKDDD